MMLPAIELRGMTETKKIKKIKWWNRVYVVAATDNPDAASGVAGLPLPKKSLIHIRKPPALLVRTQ